MRLVRMLGFAALAALAATFAGAGEGSASATVLCKEAPKAGICAEGKMYSAGQEFSAVALKPILQNSTDTINCGKSTISIGIKSTGSETESVTGVAGNHFFFECKTAKAGANCTVVPMTTPPVEFSWVSGSNGTLSLKKTEGVEPFVRVKCAIGELTLIACEFSLEVTLPFEGGDPAQFALPVTQLKALKTKGFEICPKEANWEKVTYQTSSPTAVYLAEK